MKRLFNSLYSVKSVLIITTYSVNGETQPFSTASSIVILSHTGAYFLINSSFPSKRSKVPVKHKINLYLTTLKIAENEGLAKRCTSSSISKSHSHCLLITELIISIWQFPNRFLSITFSSHCSFNISVGTTIKTKISGFFSTNKSIISRATRVFSFVIVKVFYHLLLTVTSKLGIYFYPKMGRGHSWKDYIYSPSMLYNGS